MHRLTIPLLLAACVAPDGDFDAFELSEPLVSDQLAAPSPADFELSVGNIVAGDLTTFTVSGAPANSLVLLGYSTDGLGDGPCLPSGACVGLLAPVNLLPFTIITDGAGAGSLNVRLPTNLANRTVAMQAATSGRNGQISNAISRLIIAAGTTLQPNADSDGDGFTINAGDCNDFNSGISPAAGDMVGDGLDLNCDNSDGIDGDGDADASLGSGGTDCDDADASVRADIDEVCNGIDTDCDGRIDLAADGTDACSTVETFTVNSVNLPADILVIVDDSCSMSDEQNKLAQLATNIFAPLDLAGVSYHIGVITTDTDDPAKSGRLQPPNATERYITNATTNPSNMFANRVQVGTGGAIDERGRRAADMALSAPLLTGYNAGFYRDDADLHIITMSDEDDRSASNPSRNAWINTLQTLKSGSAETFSHSLVGPTGGCATADAGRDYLAVTSLVGGLTESICAVDWNPFFDAVTNEIISRAAPNNIFPLQDNPAPADITVEVELPGLGVLVVDPSNWTYDPATQTVTITGVTLTPGAEVTITY